MIRAIFAATLLGLSVEAPAATYTVCSNGCSADTIQDAVDMADDGDIVEIGAGTYGEQVGLDRDLEIVAPVPEQTIIAGTGDAAFVIFAPVDVTFRGLRMTEGSGSLLWAQAGANIILEDIVIEDVDPPLDGSLIGGDQATISLVGSRIANAWSEWYGGGLYCSSCTVTIDSSEFEGISSPEGGCVDTWDGFTTVTNSSFANCEARIGEAGALKAGGYMGTLEVSDSVFTGNTANENGGAISTFIGGSVTGGSFTGNYANQNGGAIRGISSISSVAFDLNDAGLSGGAVSVGEQLLSVVDSDFTSNSAFGGCGGAINVSNGGDLSVLEGNFDSNFADQWGGAIYAQWGGTNDIDLSDFTLNTAGSEGGALAVEGYPGLTSISDSIFTDNSSQYKGGAILVSSGSLELLDSQITGSSAEEGGAIAAEESIIDVQRTLLCANNATYDGGAISFYWNGLLNVESSWIVENTSDTAVGGVHVHYGNTAVRLVNNHFLGNRGNDYASAMAAYGNPWLQFTNNLAAWNTGGEGAVWADDIWDEADITYNAFFENTPADVIGQPLGVGNIFTDPLLVDYSPDGDCSNDDFRPADDSPLIDAGDPALADGDGTSSDIGAYGGPNALQDSDGDGWYTDQDCNDANADVYPDAPELCNGLDDDCDGIPDDNVGVAEVCDGVDNDCDGFIDNDAIDGLKLYEDRDGDGWGTGEAISSCDLLEGLSDNNGDCDDTNKKVHPEAREIPNDEVDNDCKQGDQTAYLGGRVCSCTATGSGSAGWVIVLATLLSIRRRSG